MKSLGNRKDTVINTAAVKERDDFRIDIPNWLTDYGISLIRDSPLENKDDIIKILLFRHPELNIPPTNDEYKQYLWDIPAHAYAIHDLYIRAKFVREDHEEKYDSLKMLYMRDFEEEIRRERIVETEKKERNNIGVISENQINMRLKTDTQRMSELHNLKEESRKAIYTEEMLLKLSKLLDKRSYELQTLLDVEVRLA